MLLSKHLLFLVLLNIYNFLPVFGKGISSVLGGSCLNIYSNGLSKFPFVCSNDGSTSKPTDLSYNCFCTNENYMLTVLECIQSNAHATEEINTSLAYINDICATHKIKFEHDKLLSFLNENKNGFTNLEDQIAHYKEYVKKMKMFNFENNLQEEIEPFVLEFPIYTESTDFKNSKIEITDILSNRNMSSKLGLLLNLYWIIFPIFGLYANAIYWANPVFFIKIKSKNPFIKIRKYLLKTHLKKNESDECKKENFTASFKKNMNEQESNGHKSNSSLKQILPSKNCLWILNVYFFLVLTCFFISLKITDQGNTFFFKHINSYSTTINRSKLTQKKIMLFVADRAGILAMFQLPTLFLLSGQNNILISLTGWNYKTFNFFHKWVSRLFIILVFLHALLYLNLSISNGTAKYRWSLKKWRCACLGFVSLVFLSGTTVRKFRHYYYEIFKVTHHFFIVLFSYGLYHHIKKLGWNWLLYTSLLIWAVEYLMRLSKIIASGGVLNAKCIGIGDCPELNGYHTLKLYISHSKWWRPYPGCYVFIYILTPDLFWQRHPITVLQDPDDPTNSDVVLLIKVKNGMTKRLSELVAANGKHTLLVPVLLEGPYGRSISLKRYDKSLFVAGGMGITPVYTLALDTVKEYMQKHKLDINRNSPKSLSSSDMITDELSEKIDNDDSLIPIHIDWFVPHVEAIAVFVNEIVYLAMFGCNLISIKIHVTRFNHLDTKFIKRTNMVYDLQRATAGIHQSHIFGNDQNHSRVSSVNTFEALPSGYMEYWDNQDQSISSIKPLFNESDDQLTQESGGKIYKDNTNDNIPQTGLSKAENTKGLLSALDNEMFIDSSAPKADVISTPSSDLQNDKRSKNTNSLDTAKLGKLKTITKSSSTSSKQSKSETDSSSSGYVDDILTVKTDTERYSVTSVKEKIDLEQKLRQRQLENHKRVEKGETSKYSMSSLKEKVTKKLAHRNKPTAENSLPFEKSADYRAIKIVEILNKTFANIRIETNHLPDLIDLVEDKINIKEGSVAVVSCGPEAMKNDVKRGFLNKLHRKEDGLNLDFFEEELAW